MNNHMHVHVCVCVRTLVYGVNGEQVVFTTYSTPEQRVQTNEPMVMFT